MITTSTKLQLALSALIGRCELLVADGKLSHSEAQELNALIQHIKQLLKEQKA
jgi:hypothetical protein